MFGRDNSFLTELRTKVLVMEEKLLSIDDKVGENAQQISSSENAIQKLQMSIENLEKDIIGINSGIKNMSDNAFFRLTKTIDTKTIITWVVIVFSAASTPGVLSTLFVQAKEDQNNIELTKEELRKVIDVFEAQEQRK